MGVHALNFDIMSGSPNRIQELRRARGLSQEKLGQIVGCSKMHISGLERGTRELSLDWVRKIAAAFSVSAADLLNDEDNPFRLNPDEQDFIERYRIAGEAERENVMRVADVLIPYKSDNQR
jgi:transcriptional regulator with XRE-family HTH domain